MRPQNTLRITAGTAGTPKRTLGWRCWYILNPSGYVSIHRAGDYPAVIESNGWRDWTVHGVVIRMARPGINDGRDR